MTTSINNCVEIIKAAPKDLKNPVLLFVFPNALRHVIERYVLEVEYAWCLLNTELKRQGLRPLGTSNRSYRHLKRIRNKLVAHQVENSLRTKRHKEWYRRQYGSYEKVLELIRTVAERICSKVKTLEAQNRLFAVSVTAKVVRPFEAKDVNALFEALKSHDLY